MTAPARPADDPRTWVAVEQFARSGDRDDTAAFARALERHETVYVTPRSRPYVITAQSTRDGLPYGVLVPSNRRLVGAGAESVIHTKLPDVNRVEGAYDPGDRNAVSFFLIDWGSANVELDRLRFTGEAPVVTPASWRVNLQMTVIELAWERGLQGAAARDVRIRDCEFERHFGFIAHQRGGGRDILYAGNRHTDCMNGVNLNGDHQLCQHNRFERSEGFECSGSFGGYIENEFRNVIWAFSIGGNQSHAPGSQSQAVIVRRNTIDGVSWPGGMEAPPSGIVVADNMRDVTIEENHVLRAAGIAIHVHTQDRRRRATTDVRILRNTLLSNGLREAVWNRYPIYIDQVDDVTIDGNVIADHLPGEPVGAGHRFAARAGIFVTKGGRGLRIGRNEMHLDAPPVTLPDDYEGVEWAGARPPRDR